jgi:hypothetical protein
VSWILPTAIQTALLQASLLEGDRRDQALAQFRAQANLDDLDPGSHRLLPLYYRRLANEGSNDPEMGRLKGVHHKSWYENLLLRHNAEPILANLHEAGVETMLLKGVGLHTTIYAHEPALRPIADLDVLISLKQVPQALRALESAGFSQMELRNLGQGASEWGNAQLYSATWYRYTHAATFIRGEKESVDLHVRPLHYQLDASYTQRVWSRRVDVRLGATDTTTMDPTDHLLIAIIHGMARNVVPPCRWVADAVLLIRNEQIDWERLCNDALLTWYPRSVQAGLRYLRAELDAPVPESIDALLKRRRPILWRGLEAIAVRPRSRAKRLASAVIVDYLLASLDRGLWGAIREYPAYVRTRNYRGWRRTVARILRVALRGINSPA